MLNYTSPAQGIPAVLAAALSGALPPQQPQGMQSPATLAGRVAGQNASAFMPLPPSPQQQQPQMGGMGGMGGNPLAAMMAHMQPQQPISGGMGNIPGVGQMQLPNLPALQQQGPLSGIGPWLRGMFSGPTG